MGKPRDDKGGNPGRASRRGRRPRLWGIVPRERTYLVMMGACVLLVVLAWSFVRHYSVAAAASMTVAALFIPPAASIIANAGPVNRQ